MTTSTDRRVRDLQQQLAEAKATIDALLSGQIDAVVDATNGTPVLLAEAQAALQASLGEFRSLAEAMPQIVWITRPDGGNIYFNHQWTEYTGLTLEESLGEGWNKPFHPDDQQRAWDAWQLATATIGTYSIESRLRRADGVYRWWLVRGVPLQDAGGAILKWFGTCTDIHDLKVAELEISRINRALGMLSRCNGALIRTKHEPDLLNEICQIAVEAGGYRMAWIGYAQDDEARSITPMAHAGAEDGYLADITVTWNANEPNGQGPAGEVILTGQAVVCDDLGRISRFSHWTPFARQRGYLGAVSLPLRDAAHTFGLLVLYSPEVNPTSAEELRLLQEMADNLAFGIGNLRAESERARLSSQVLEQADLLRAAEERMRFALDTAKVGIWDMDCATGATKWSETLETQYGLQRGAFGGTYEAFVALIHPEDRASVRATVEAAMKSGADFSFLNRAVWPDGAVQWLTGAGRFLIGEDGHAARGVGISQNITERRTLERQYQQAQKMEAIGQLASGVAHDFNNLLTVIQGFAGFVADDAGLDQRHARDLGEIIKAAERAAGLTRQLLAFSRQQVLQTAPIDVNVLLTNMSAMLGRLIGEDIDISLVLAPGLPLALADRGQLEQVVMNLVVNARDAMPGGGRMTIETMDVELENSSFLREAVMQGNYVMLSVTDTGTGMTEETKQHLFEPFFTTKESGKGTGLGLSTSYGIVKQSGGYIWVYSELGHGTTFKVYLPRANREATVATVSTMVTPPVKRTSETVLLVEDEEGVRVLAKRILENAGYRVLEATNGDNAERVFAQHADAIDLLVTDVVMPGCGGPELLARLHQRSPAVKVLYMSGYTAQSAAQKAGIDRGAPFVQKPFTASELVRQVRRVLDG